MRHALYRLSTAGCVLCVAVGCATVSVPAHTERFCLTGEFDLGVRLQGMAPRVQEVYPARWCVVTQAATDRVRFYIEGHSNPDMTDSFTVNYLPPDRVRIVRTDAPPDIEFGGKSVVEEARRHRRIDPRRLVEELRDHPQWLGPVDGRGWQSVRYPGSEAATRVRVVDHRLQGLRTQADLPLRGRVPVEWKWQWTGAVEANAELTVDGERIFRGRASWQSLTANEGEDVFAPSGGVPPREVAGNRWPARIDMQLDTLAEGVHMVRGVRTGFHHLVVETRDGLVVGDAPAGWVELPQVPPADLVPGLGISGLAEGFVDFLSEAFQGQPLRAVALTHAHDDHAGGARAFAAAGAEVYAPRAIADYLETALNEPRMPADRMRAGGTTLEVVPVRRRHELSDGQRTIVLIEMNGSPHVETALGVWVREPGYFFQSDLHVPRDEGDTPRADRAATECWFARWAVAHLPSDTIVLSSHTAVATPVARLQRYLESEGCRNLSSSAAR